MKNSEPVREWEDQLNEELTGSDLYDCHGNNVTIEVKKVIRQVEDDAYARGREEGAMEIAKEMKLNDGKYQMDTEIAIGDDEIAYSEFSIDLFIKWINSNHLTPTQTEKEGRV